MPDAGTVRTPNQARNLEAGMLLIGVGAILLLISLFLSWYQPGVEAWDIFEVWDLVLAALAICALVAVASRFGVGAPRPRSWLLGPAVAALVIVLYAIIDPPPLTRGIDGDPDTGLWLALAATVLMAAGAMLSVARISVAFTAQPAAPRAASRYGREPGPAGGDLRDPVAPRGPVPPAGPGSPAGPGPAVGPVPPTEPTRRL